MISVLTGVVAEFAADTGLGAIDTGGVLYPFHCIEIADGTRDIALGVDVTFEVLCKLGRYEAASIS